MSSIVSSDDPADLFVQLFDLIGDGPFRSGEARAWDRDPALRERAAEVDQQVRATGRVPRPLVDSLLDEGDRGVFALLRGLDLALSYVNPFTGRHDPGRMYKIARRYAKYARLNTDAVAGALLFNCAFAGRPLGIPEKAQYFELLRVPEADWESVEHGWLDSKFDMTIRRVVEPGDTEVAVACAPMAGSPDELVVEPVSRFGERRYRIRPRFEPLRKRVEDVLRKLDESGALIGLLPEATLSDELLEEWKAALKRRRRVQTRLRWLVVGTGPIGDADPPYNRAIVLDRRNGQVVLENDKHADFELTAHQVKVWGLQPYLGEGGATEDITKGEVIRLRECNLGRIAILICEDLGRTMTIGATLAKCGVSHVFSPIFSPPFTGQYGWVEHPAHDYVYNLGAWVVVANSLAVYSAIDASDVAEDEAKEVAAKAPTCYALGPTNRRDEWRLNKPQEKRAPTPDEVELVYVSGGTARRYEHFDP